VIIISILTLASFILLCQATATLAQEYPNRSITLIIGYAPGGSTDLTARALADAASKILGQPVVAINKAGGTSSVALSVLMNEKPDGYTIGIMPAGGVVASLLHKVPYDPVKDFTHIMQYGYYESGCVVRAESPWKTFPEFIDYAGKNPEKVSFATAGAGTPEHLIMERLMAAYGLKMRHLPFEGDAPASVALLGGHVDALSISSGAWKSHVDAGRLRILVIYNEKRSSVYSQVPTLLELGYNMAIRSLISIVGPKGMPDPIVAKLHSAFEQAMKDPGFVNAAEKTGVPLNYRGPQELREYVKTMVDENGTMIQKLGLRK